MPGETPADTHRIYGLNTTPTLLLEIPSSAEPFELSTLVPDSYPRYAVSGVKDDTESKLVEAAEVEEDCIDIDPPGIVIRCVPIIHKPLGLAQFRIP